MSFGIRITQVGEWNRAAVILRTAPFRIRRAIDRAVLQEAQFFRRKVVEGFREQAPGGKAFKPLAATTLAIRKFRGKPSSKILIVDADLRNSVKVVHRPTPLGAEAFVGVLRSARKKKGEGTGKPLVNIARVHEFGVNRIVIKVTPAMRRFLHAALKNLGGPAPSAFGPVRTGVIITKIPARPFLQPVADKWFEGPKAAARFQGRVAANMGGILGAFGTVRIPPRVTGLTGRDSASGRFVRAPRSGEEFV